jgi:hypothetical protein
MAGADMTRDEFRSAVTQALEALGVAGEVQLTDTSSADDGTHEARLSVSATGDAEAHVRLGPGLDPARAAREIRAELRRALRLCPLCQRIGHVEKIRDAAGSHAACLVVCPSCGRYEIDQAVIKDLRAAWERGDADVLGQLPALSNDVRQGNRSRLSAGDWRPKAGT